MSDDNQRQGGATSPDLPRLAATSDDSDYSLSDMVVREIAPRHPDIDAALAEGLADIQAGRVSPAFTTAEEIAAWQKTAEYKKFIGKE
jgi:predicted transcriptional regulator